MTMPDTQGVRKRARRNISASPSAQDGGEASALVEVNTTSLLIELPLDLIVLTASYFSMKDQRTLSHCSKAYRSVMRTANLNINYQRHLVRDTWMTYPFMM